MNIEELIKEIGAKNTEIQFLCECMVSSQDLKNQTKISFVTETKVNDLVKEDGKDAIIIWVKKKKIKQAFRKLNKNVNRGKK